VNDAPRSRHEEFKAVSPKRIAWVGNKYFSRHMTPLGWEIMHLPAHPPLDWEGVLSSCGCMPHVVVYGDQSLPPPLLNLHAFPCPTVFVCVDSHIHSWYPDYAQAFDLCLINLKDNIPRFQGGRLPDSRIIWTPLYALPRDRPRKAVKEWDLIFVGTVDPDLTPGRHAFLREVQALVPGLHVTRGRYWELYPRARLVLNEAWRGDLNFRVFEALGCGACLLTPEVGHGQNELFTPGKDLFTYPAGDAEAVAELARRLLQDADLRERVAASGLAKVDAAHRATHRARELDALLKATPLGQLTGERLDQAEAIHRRHLKPLYLAMAENLDQAGDRNLRTAYLNAAISS
jgi:glycosyltransferase involved in cell wall biosynthesis